MQKARIAGGVLATVALVGLFAWKEHSNIDKEVFKPERTTISQWLRGKSLPQADPTVITVSSRAYMRDTPAVFNGDGRNPIGERDNHADSSGSTKDRTLVVRNPLVQDGFYGMIDPENPVNPDEFKALSPEDQAAYLADRVIWVSGKSQDGTSLVETYTNPTMGDTAGDQLQAHITADGSLAMPGGQAAGEAEFMSIDDASFLAGTLQRQ